MPRFLFPTKKHLSQIANFDRIGQKGLNREMRKIFISILPIVLYTMDSVALTVTCADKGASCTIESENQDNISTLNTCADLSTQIITNPVLISNDGINSLWSKCSSKLKQVNCEYGIKYLDNDKQVLVFCETNKPTILYKTDVIADSTFSMSYKQKQCVGSDGTWNNESCRCPTNADNKSHDTQLEDNECICNTGNTKYRIAHMCTEVGCHATGGTFAGGNSTAMNNNPQNCICIAPNTEKDGNKNWCKCKSGYRYRDPTRRWEGCVSIKNNTIQISGTVKDDKGTLQSATVSWYNENGGQEGVITDQNGLFNTLVPNTAYVTFSFIGHIPNTFAATDLKRNQSIILYPSDIELDTVTITSDSDTDATTTPADSNIKYYDNGECAASGGKWDSTKSVCICNKADATKHLHPEPIVETYTDPETNEILYYSICRCANGYKRENGEYNSECIDADDTITEKVTDYTKMRENAESAYQAARDHEQSWENKALTAGTTLATGAGTMQAITARAEQQADADAERDMAAYLATMRCEYGDGKNITVGNTEITLPGGNELLEYYSEYKALADSVKQTKTALGLRAGIESETLYDRAQSSLYQYGSVGKQSGANISLANALMDSESEDAAKWNAQKEQTAQNLKTGTTIAVTGAAAGIVGNYLINRNWKPSPLIEVLKPVITRVANEHPQTFEPIPVVVSEPEVTGGDSPQQPEYQQFSQLKIPVQNGVFKSGQLELTEQAKSDLDKLVQSIKNSLKEPKYAKAELKISVDAYTDGQSLGPETRKRLNVKDNDELSKARANAILNQLKTSFDNTSITYVPKGNGVHKDCTNPKGEPINKANEACRQLIITVEDTYNY